MSVDHFRFLTSNPKLNLKAPKAMQTPTEDFSAAPEQHVAVLAFPFASHAAQLLSLVRKLAAAVPKVTFSFYSTAESNESLSAITNPENIKAFDLPGCMPEGYVFSGNLEEKINLFLEVAEESFTEAMQAAEADIGRRISLLMSDAFLWFVGEKANRTGVPWVPVWNSGANSVSTHFYTDLIRETIGMKGQETQIVKFIPGFSELCLGDLPSGVLFGDIESPFAVMLHKMGQVLHKATAVAVNSFEELDPEINKDLKSKFRNFLNVGPFNRTSPPPPSSMSDEYGCVRWLDKLKPASVAYIGFGTATALPPNELLALAEALEASGTPFLWSLKENYQKNLPEGFAERTSGIGKIVPWAPQKQVLGHNSVGVFISHCGWNSMVETIAAGVPIIGRPVFGDQKLNAWMVENVWKIGVRVEGDVLTKSGAMLALELVLSPEKGRKLKAQVGRLRELALEAVGPKGSSTRNFIALQEVVTGRRPI